MPVVRFQTINGPVKFSAAASALTKHRRAHQLKHGVASGRARQSLHIGAQVAPYKGSQVRKAARREAAKSSASRSSTTALTQHRAAHQQKHGIASGRARQGSMAAGRQHSSSGGSTQVAHFKKSQVRKAARRDAAKNYPPSRSYTPKPPCRECGR